MEPLTLIYIIMFFFGIYFLLFFLILFKRNKSKMREYPEVTNFPYISSIVPAYNEEGSLRDTIKALVEIDYPEDKREIIIINDGSKDKTLEVARELAKEYKIVRVLNKKNSGKADSLNQAIKIAKGEIIAVTDADSYPERDTFMKMVGFFQDEKVGAVTSRVFVKNNKKFFGKFQDVDYRVIAWSRKILDYVDSVYVTNGPLSMYRAKILREVGGFDRNNVTEDIEVTWNILSRGYKTRMSYGAIVYTTAPLSFDSWVKQRIRWNLGGLQTIYKYKKNFLDLEKSFGYFVVPYVSLAFFLALVGIVLFSRFLWAKFSFYFFSIPFITQGYNPFKFMDFTFPFTVLFILGALFLIFSFVYYRVSLSDYEGKSILTIIAYGFLYRPLYIFPLLGAVNKLLKRDIRWYTK